MKFGVARQEELEVGVMLTSSTTECRISATAVKRQYSSFDDMIQHSPVPILVDFYATWCGPCVMMADVLEVRKIHTQSCAVP